MSHVIYAILEGDDNERFINKVIKPELEKKHSRVKVYKCAQTARIDLEKFVNLLNKSDTAYIFLSDMDRAPCYTKKKEWIKSKTVKNVNGARIAIVKTEIESWYLAGLDRHSAKSLKIRHFSTTEHISKEDFNKISEKYASKIDCVTAILQKFSIDVAKIQMNRSNIFAKNFFNS